MGIETSRHILVAPLDWGLGHTTRCVPIIRHLLHLGHKVTFAGCDWQIDYLEKTFPGIEALYLEGYNVHYGKSAKAFIFNILLQVPRLLKVIRTEHKWLKEKHEKTPFDLVISDNRYGLHLPDVSSVIMTHQLQILTGMGSVADTIARRLHYRMLSRFSSCWVPDVEGQPNLSGSLGHPGKLPPNVQYIGPLSQLPVAESTVSTGPLVILLSGPEPQRTLLSDMLWAQIEHFRDQVIFIEGTDKYMRTDVPANVDYHGRLGASALLPVLQAASLVICRSGYSTIMDLIALQKKAILIPTPGQTEQEHLARHLSGQKAFLFSPQQSFELNTALQEAAVFPFIPIFLTSGFQSFAPILERHLNVI